MSDIADEAGVAYGLVYHYFRSKDEVLDTLFLERWNVLLDADPRGRRQDIPAARQARTRSPSFIVDSYRHDPDLMKVIIVEVTRAANSFGQTHLAKIREAYELIADIVAKAQERRRVQATTSRRSSPRWRSTARSSRCSPAGSSSCCPRATRSTSRPRTSSSRRSAAGLDRGAPAVCGRLPVMDNEIVKRLLWSGLLAGLGALAIDRHARRSRR